jgi:hypothetical protein
MGCKNSKDESRFRTMDDSVHARIKLDRKRQIEHGETPHAYKPRPVPPIVQQKAKEETKEADASAVNASGNTE